MAPACWAAAAAVAVASAGADGGYGGAASGERAPSAATATVLSRDGTSGITVTVETGEAVAVWAGGAARRTAPGGWSGVGTVGGVVLPLAGPVAVNRTANRTALSVCVSRAGAVSGGVAVRVSDCFAPSAVAASAVEWTTTVESDAAAMWTAPVGRGLLLSRSPVDAVWAAWDVPPGSGGAQPPVFLLDAVPASSLVNTTFWLGGKLTTPGEGCNEVGGKCSGAYAFGGPKISVPVAAVLPSAAAGPGASGGGNGAGGVALALNLDDFLSTEVALNVTASGAAVGVAFEHRLYRLGGGSAPLVLRADVVSVADDPRAVLGAVAARHPTFFSPAVGAARTAVGGTAWYSRCGPAVGGCDIMATNKTFAEELAEIAFGWVWNNNFAEYFMGNYIPPVANSSQVYVSDAGVPVSVDLLRARYRGFRQRNVTELPYFSIMEFGGGVAKYAMACPPPPPPPPPPFPPGQTKRGRSDPPQPQPSQVGPVNIQPCDSPAADSEIAWRVVPSAARPGDVQLELRPNATDPQRRLCLTAVHESDTYHGHPLLNNDELNALPCNASDGPQLWRWAGAPGAGASKIVTAMTRAEKDARWNGRAGRCNGWPCCVDVNAHEAAAGFVLQGEDCDWSTAWKATPVPAARTSIKGLSDHGAAGDDGWIRVEAAQEPGFCMAFSSFPWPPPSPPPPPPPPAPPTPPWADPNAYYHNRSLGLANLRASDGRCVYSPGWGGAFVMDPLDADYLELLLEEAERHVAMLGGDFAGVSCDRGWPQLLNAHADDGVSFCAGGPCRSLLFSLRAAMARVGKVFHGAGKVVSYNPVQVPRVDLMEHYDAIFTEMGFASQGELFLVAAMSPLKPATMWTTQVPTAAQFEAGLLHGVFPMAPSPNGDHSLGLDGLDAFLEFGPMLRALRGRVWVLDAHAVAARDGAGRLLPANLFDVPASRGNGNGSSSSTCNVAVVVLPPGASPPPTAVTLSFAEPKANFAVLQRGRAARWTPAGALRGGGGTEVRVTLQSTIAMVRMGLC